MQASRVRAVLFVKELGSAAPFYIGALGMMRVSGDEDHVILDCGGYDPEGNQLGVSERK